MENIYKVKIKTNPNPRGLYPSERRYSASTVLGLSVLHLFFCGLSLIFTFLCLLNEPSDEDGQLNHQDVNQSKFSISTIEDRRKRDVVTTVTSIIRFYLILTTLLLTIGCLLAGLTGLLAWKRWYIDNNIKWFFATSLLSSSLSGISTACSVISIVVMTQKVSSIDDRPRANLHLTVHILITSTIELVVSITSMIISYAGMKNTYPDDIVMPNGRGKIEVNTVLKGNKKKRISPPDILSHFHMAEKFAKYFPRRESSYLPKAESNAEYQERVRQFLSSRTETAVCKY